MASPRPLLVRRTNDLGPGFHAFCFISPTHLPQQDSIVFEAGRHVSQGLFPDRLSRKASPRVEALAVGARHAHHDPNFHQTRAANKASNTIMAAVFMMASMLSSGPCLKWCLRRHMGLQEAVAGIQANGGGLQNNLLPA